MLSVTRLPQQYSFTTLLKSHRPHRHAVESSCPIGHCIATRRDASAECQTGDVSPPDAMQEPSARLSARGTGDSWHERKKSCKRTGMMRGRTSPRWQNFLTRTWVLQLACATSMRNAMSPRIFHCSPTRIMHGRPVPAESDPGDASVDFGLPFGASWFGGVGSQRHCATRRDRRCA